MTEPFNGVPTSRQQVALAVVPKITALFSILGSSYIIYDAGYQKLYLKRANHHGGNDNSSSRRRKRQREQGNGVDGAVAATTEDRDSGGDATSARWWGRSCCRPLRRRTRRSDAGTRRTSSSSSSSSSNDTYHRLMVGLSVCDLLMSIGLFTSTWPMPADTMLVWGASGTTETCELVGFLEQAGLAAVLYNASLSTYYLLRIRCGWTARRITRIEMWALHPVPIVLALATMIASLALNLFNQGLWDCWIAPFPQGCTETWRSTADNPPTCVRGDNASLYIWVFDLIPKWSAILVVTLNMVLTYRAVYVQEKQTLKYTDPVSYLKKRSSATQQGQLQLGDNSAATSVAALHSAAAAAAARASGAIGPDHSSSNGFSHADPSSSNGGFSVGGGAATATGGALVTTGTAASGAGEGEPSSATVSSSPPSSPFGRARTRLSAAMLSARGGTPSAASPPSESSSAAFALAQQQQQQQRPKLRVSRRLARQSYFYVGALYITYIPVVITRATQLSRGYVYYQMLMTISVTIPLQGLWNGKELC